MKLYLYSLYRRKVNIFLAMTGCLAHFPGKGNLLICESRNKNLVPALQYIIEYI